MTQYKDRTHVVYLLKRKSDQLPYVGITIKDRIQNRINCHKISDRFHNDDFTFEILEESKDRTYIEMKEEYYIEKYDSFENGLNKSPEGKRHNHDSSKFTTFGYKFTDTQRKKMSESAKARAKREGHKKRSDMTKKAWENESYRKRQSEVRKNKRLRPPKLTDDQVEEIRHEFNKQYDVMLKEANVVNEYRKNKNGSRKMTTPIIVFSKKYCDDYGVCYKTLVYILQGKHRKKKLECLYKS